MARKTYILLIMMSITFAASAQSADRDFRIAQKNYQNKNYAGAEKAFRNSLDKRTDPTTYYNLGNTLYKQERYDEAAEQYNKAIRQTEEKSLRSKAFYNLGNSQFQEQKYTESIEAYKQAIRNNPDHENARKNLGIARKMLQQHMEESGSQSMKDEQITEAEDKSNSKDQQQSGNEKNQEPASEQDTGKGNSEEKDLSENSFPEDLNSKLNKDDLLKLLKLIEEEDKNVQKKLQKGQDRKSEKDW